MKIIVAIDGSQWSEAAIDALVNLKWASGTEVKLLMAIDAPDNILAFGAKADPKRHQELVDAASDNLKGMAEALQARLKDCSVTHQVAQGEPKSQIVEIAKQWPANLVIMGSRGLKGVELMLLGSVSQSVLMQSPCPVMIAKAGPDKNSEQGFKKILITVDNSPYSNAAVNWLMSIDWGDSAIFKIATVVQPLVDSFDNVGSIASAAKITFEHDTTTNSAEDELNKWAAKLTEKVGKGNVSIQVSEGDPREAILEIADEWSADLIVMGSHGRTGLDKLLLGSVSQAVAQHAPCSVAIVRGLLPKGQGGRAKKQQTGMFHLPAKS